jgi:hypothetical protein
MESCSDTPCVVGVAAVFASPVVCAVFVSVAGWEIELHMFAPLTGKEERLFRRTTSQDPPKVLIKIYCIG